MKFRIVLFALCIFTFIGYSQDSPKDNITTYILVRHAEKDLSDPSNRNPNLTTEGKERANNLVAILKDIHIDKVYSTNYKRTLQTAEPLAKDRKIEIELYDPRKIYDKAFQEITKGKTSLIVGHSNSTPTLVNKIIGKEKYQSIDEKVYSKLFIITLQDDKVSDMILNFN
ncbi:SixA phosphatase family protein [Aquimarina litoralis]|uniref:SixA phosphatase family protein n=1 Tax=Aquimarina litoralis TaxID=584605 RepID=UPI001C5981C8|nr:histidine phosphatase family protein [Aquimarina litoralis]MBW1297535.1 phosphoglycerate mutase [Aquimarina litoralis]